MVDIPDEDVPLADMPAMPSEEETLEELPEEEVPLAKVPKTGDGSHGALWTAMGFLSMIGLAALSLLKPKKDEE